MYCGVILSMIAVVQMTAGHSFHIGDCPNVQPMSEFDMEKFLGKWYVIEKTSSSNKHQVLTYSHAEGPGEYRVLENAVRPIVGKSDYSGTLKPSDTKPALMKVKFQLNPGSYDYIVFMTDYENYAGVFSCQKILGTNRRAASILSRTPTLDQSFVEKVRERLDYFGVNPNDLSVIEQVKPAEGSSRSSSKPAENPDSTKSADDDDDNEKAPVWDLDPRFGEITQASNATELHLFKKRSTRRCCFVIRRLPVSVECAPCGNQPSTDDPVLSGIRTPNAISRTTKSSHPTRASRIKMDTHRELFFV